MKANIVIPIQYNSIGFEKRLVVWVAQGCGYQLLPFQSVKWGVGTRVLSRAAHLTCIYTVHVVNTTKNVFLHTYKFYPQNTQVD